MDQLIGQIIDNYKILEVIGRGGMGVVFKAMDMSLEKIVALKMIDPFLARDGNFLERFKTEAKALAKLENQNIVGVYALRETTYGLFMVMEYVQAKTISEWLREKGRFTASETIAIGSQIINAIRHAHKVGVIHRDIKPNNVLLCEDGTVKVMDFGLAKVIQEQGTQNTVTHAAAGTLYYMSPEQVKGLKNVDKRSDIYSIGMTLYEMLAGRTPFEKGESEFVIQKQIVEGKIPSPVKYNPLIPKELVKIILKAIDKEPEKRFQGTGEMFSALSGIKTDTAGEEEKTRIMTRYDRHEETKPKPDKKKLYISAVAITLIALIIAIYFMTGKKAEVIDNTPGKTRIEQTKKIIPASLSVKSDPPGASVYINGKSEGKTPLSMDSLTIARYSIMLKLNGYEDWHDAGYMVNEGLNEVNIKMEPMATVDKAFVTLKSVPASDIYIDGNKIASNSGEQIRNSVSTGKHTIKFVNAEYGTKSVSVDLSSKQNKQITCYFQQQVNIQSLSNTGDPIWGMIYLNGNSTDKTTPGDLNLGPGTYKITVKKTGYKTAENDVQLTIAPTFEPKTHSLVFHFK
ncbi:MAG TPA: serine/threonine-protein kinase [Ignavibacteriaceae bacterium]